MTVMINCKHINVIVEPSEVKIVGDEIKISGLESGTLRCRECQEILPIEDMAYYNTANISVAIPEHLTEQ